MHGNKQTSKHSNSNSSFQQITTQKKKGYAIKRGLRKVSPIAEAGDHIPCTQGGLVGLVSMICGGGNIMTIDAATTHGSSGTVQQSEGSYNRQMQIMTV